MNLPHFLTRDADDEILLKGYRINLYTMTAYAGNVADFQDAIRFIPF